MSPVHPGEIRGPSTPLMAAVGLGVLAFLAVLMGTWSARRPDTAGLPDSVREALDAEAGGAEAARSPREAVRPFLQAALEGRDPSSAHLKAYLAKQPEPARREAVAATVEAFVREPAPPQALMPALRSHPDAHAAAVVGVLEEDPAKGLAQVERFFFPGGRPDPEAWRHEGLRRAVAALCARSGDLERDLETGPLRARALRIAGRAKLREAIPAIKAAAGLGEDEEGRARSADPHGSALLMARQIVRTKLRRSGS